MGHSRINSLPTHMFLAAAVVLGAQAVGQKARAAFDGVRQITVEVPDSDMEALERGEGDPARLYEFFAREVDPSLNQGQEPVTVEITVDGRTSTIRHTPNRVSFTPAPTGE